MPKYNTVQDLLSDPTRWLQGTMARDAQGFACGTYSPDAARWCLLGAIHAVYPEKGATRIACNKLATSIKKWFPSRLTERFHRQTNLPSPHVSDDTIIIRFGDHPNTQHDDVRLVIVDANI